MAKVAELLVEVGAKTDKLKQGLDKGTRQVNKFGQTVKRIGGIIAAAFSVRAVLNFTKAIASAYDIQAQAENQLLVALKGRRDIQQSLIKQAKDLQKTTIFGDEETIRAQALIAAFVKEEHAIKRIIPLVQDLAVAKQMQLSVAADLVSKTLGSSTNALSRYGIQVEGAVGSTQRLENLVQGLTRAFGGQAEAAAKVGLGPLTQLKNIYGDLKEELGENIVKSETFQDVIGRTKNIVNATTAGLQLSQMFRELHVSVSELVGSKKLEKFTSLIANLATFSWVQQGPLGVAAQLKAMSEAAKEFPENLIPPQQQPLEQITKSVKNIKAPLIDTMPVIKQFNEALDDTTEQASILATEFEPGWGSVLNKLSYGLHKVKTESELLRESLQYTFEDALMGSLMVADQGIEAFFKSILGYLKAFLARQAAIKIASALINAIFPGGGTAFSAITQNWGGFPGGGLPGLQHGGIVTQPTIAAIGEKGPEAVIPLGGKSLNIKVEGQIRNKYIYLANKSYEYELSRTT